MTRTIFSRVMWVGRAPVFLVGLVVDLGPVGRVCLGRPGGHGEGSSLQPRQDQLRERYEHAEGAWPTVPCSR